MAQGAGARDPGCMRHPSPLLRHRTLLVTLAAAVALVACGGSTDVPGDQGNDTGTANPDALSDGTSNDSSTSDGNTDTAVDDGGGDVVATDGDGAPPVCSSEPTKAKCQECCVAEHKEGSKTFDAALIACACTDGVCKTECATTACASPATAPDAACKACLGASVKSPGDAGSPDAAGPDGKCVGPVTSACSSDAKCVAYVTCLQSCG